MSNVDNIRGDYCADRLKAIADSTRWQILVLLRDGAKCVKELNLDLGVEQSLLSHHLRILRDAGMIEGERDGKAVRYRLCDGIAVDGPRPGIDLGCCTLLLS